MLAQKGSDFCSITRNKGINGRLCLQNRAETLDSARLWVCFCSYNYLPPILSADLPPKIRRRTPPTTIAAATPRTT